MKILIFSDTHLHLPFDEKQYDFLKEIISKSDRVIINGDFFDGYLNTFDEFVNSSWRHLFPLLKSKKAIYLYGNHDNKKFSDRRVSLFSEAAVDHYKLIIHGKTYIIEHGHMMRPTPDTKYVSQSFWKNIVRVQHKIESILLKTFKYSFMKIRYGLIYNQESKRLIKKYYQPKDNEVYIVGHNHIGEIDEKNHFACCGMILHGFAQYITINDGKLSLHSHWYK